MAVTKRGNKYQSRFQHKGQRFGWSFFCPKEARDWEVQQTKRLECGLPVEYPGNGTKETVKAGRKKDLGTLGALVEHVSATRWDHNKAGWERKLRAKKVVEFFGPERRVEDVFDELERLNMVNAMKKKGLTNSTINRHLSVISTLKTIALEKDVVHRADKIRLLPQAPGE